MKPDDGQLAPVATGAQLDHLHAHRHLRVMTWNVQHASTARTLRQSAWITAQPADVVVLTEVAATDAGRILAENLGENGFQVCCPSGSDNYRTLVASRIGTQEPCPHIQADHLPHRCVAVRLHLPEGPTVGLVGLYVPSRGNRERRNADKRAFQKAVATLLPSLPDALAVDGPTVIAGDLNVVEPGHQPHHAVFGTWEYDFYRAFGASRYGDAFRHLHPEQLEHSWYGRRSGAGYRFDHIFCSPVKTVTDCRYLHQPRRDGLSDHSAITATIVCRQNIA